MKFKNDTIKGQIKILQSLYLSAVLNKEQFEMMVDPLRKQLETILSQAEASNTDQKRNGLDHSSGPLI